MSGEYQLVADNAPVIIGATGLKSIEQNIRMIVLTTVYSCPMDRGFANSGSYIDSPLPYAAAGRIAELTQAIETKEPRVRVVSIHMRSTGTDGAMEGRVVPVITYRLREGVEI